jgi:rhomboid family GlyGly-CTERM serine protease
MITNNVADPLNQVAENASLARSLNCDGKRGFWLLAALAALLLPLAGGAALRAVWRYEREAVAAGEWWRLLTSHFVHLDAGHAVLNAAGLALLWGLFARCWTARSWWCAILTSLAAIDLGFWFCERQLQWYVGASGLLHGVFAFGCLALVRERDPIGIIAALIFVAKLSWEHWQGPLPFERSAPVVTVAHLYGAMGGACAALAIMAAGISRGRAG